jgi:hypothetical protein
MAKVTRGDFSRPRACRARPAVRYSDCVCFWVMQRIPFDPFSLFSDKRQLAFTPLYYIVISLPFFCSGLALALLFTRGGPRVNRLYAFDLVGAGVGCAGSGCGSRLLPGRSGFRIEN